MPARLTCGDGRGLAAAAVSHFECHIDIRRGSYTSSSNFQAIESRVNVPFSLDLIVVTMGPSCGLLAFTVVADIG